VKSWEGLNLEQAACRPPRRRCFSRLRLATDPIAPTRPRQAKPTMRSSAPAGFVLAILCAAAPRATGTNVEGKKFLQDKAEEPGVVTLPSGLMYKVLTEGDGDSHPTADSSCSCHYAGTLTDGSEFDSSYGRGEPTDFAPNQVIPGWTEAMQLMVEGDK
jgi:FKBP-type peptidyl-prolyl cis-trans isomerase